MEKGSAAVRVLPLIRGGCDWQMSLSVKTTVASFHLAKEGKQAQRGSSILMSSWVVRSPVAHIVSPERKLRNLVCVTARMCALHNLGSSFSCVPRRSLKIASFCNDRELMVIGLGVLVLKIFKILPSL